RGRLRPRPDRQPEMVAAPAAPLRDGAARLHPLPPGRRPLPRRFCGSRPGHAGLLPARIDPRLAVSARDQPAAPPAPLLSLRLQLRARAAAIALRDRATGGNRPPCLLVAAGTGGSGRPPAGPE